MGVAKGTGLIYSALHNRKKFLNGHPAPFPASLIQRIISSTDGRIVLDPFMGSGTTAVVARDLKRNYIGIDISPEYCRMARERIRSGYASVAEEKCLKC